MRTRKHTIELLEEAEQVAQQLGYGVRAEWLGGCGGGACEVAGRKWIFIDLSATASEQLAQLTSALSADAAIQSAEISDELASYWGLRRAA